MKVNRSLCASDSSSQKWKWWKSYSATLLYRKWHKHSWQNVSCLPALITVTGMCWRNSKENVIEICFVCPKNSKKYLENTMELWPRLPSTWHLLKAWISAVNNCSLSGRACHCHFGLLTVRKPELHPDFLTSRWDYLMLPPMQDGVLLTVKVNSRHTESTVSKHLSSTTCVHSRQAPKWNVWSSWIRILKCWVRTRSK